MKQIKFSMVVAIFVVLSINLIGLFGCQQSAKDSGQINTDNNKSKAVKRITDSINKPHSNTVVATDTLNRDRTNRTSNSKDNDSSNDTPRIPLREGTHDLSLQWISWTHMGKAQIKYLGDNKYSISGEQRSKENSDYLKIEGTLLPITDKELQFEGRVEHQVYHLNQGLPCIKEGNQIFKSTKNRKYWRMMNMKNCEGGMVTDYIDIYF